MFINESSSVIGKKYFSTIKNNSSCFSSWCRNSKENTWFWNHNFNNYKWRNEEIVQALEDSNILLKGITKTIENDTKGQKEEFLGMLLGVLGAILLRNKFTGNGIWKPGYGNK